MKKLFYSTIAFMMKKMCCLCATTVIAGIFFSLGHPFIMLFISYPLCRTLIDMILLMASIIDEAKVLIFIEKYFHIKKDVPWSVRYRGIYKWMAWVWLMIILGIANEYL